ncbi:unnamed protein product [Leuciscus chuanchicus]
MLIAMRELRPQFEPAARIDMALALCPQTINPPPLQVKVTACLTQALHAPPPLPLTPHPSPLTPQVFLLYNCQVTEMSKQKVTEPFFLNYDKL